MIYHIGTWNKSKLRVVKKVSPDDTKLTNRGFGVQLYTRVTTFTPVYPPQTQYPFLESPYLIKGGSQGPSTTYSRVRWSRMFFVNNFSRTIEVVKRTQTRERRKEWYNRDVYGRSETVSVTHLRWTPWVVFVYDYGTNNMSDVLTFGLFRK